MVNSNTPLELARVLMPEPRLALLDEPITGVIDGLRHVAVSSTLTEVDISRISNNTGNVLRNISGSLLIVVAFYMMVITLRELI